MSSDHQNRNEVRPGELSGIIARLWVRIQVWIPIGYQNETGFHYGTQSISSILERLSEKTALAGD
jgi:hypothetical protein